MTNQPTALRRIGIGLYVLSIFALSLYFYGVVRSFPLISDDGAANYLSMLHAAHSGNFWDLSFKLKWFEGLGQPNLFYSSLFDPFNWLLYLDIPPEDAFRVSYALRASVCWLLTYLLVRRVLPDSTALATTAATLNVLLSFLLGTPGGVPAWAGIHHLTQVTLFPGLLWTYLGTVHNRRWAGGPELAFAAYLLLFLLNYPLNSLLGVTVLGSFAFAAVLVAGQMERGAAARALGKFLVIVAVLLFFPGFGVYGDWSAVTASAARVVFNHELQTMLIPGYEWPNFWRYGMPEVRVVVLFALALLMYTGPLPWAARSMVVALVLNVIAVQAVTLFYAYGFAPELFRRLPAPSRLELYLTPFYAFCAAVAIHGWLWIAFPLARTRIRWFVGSAAFLIMARIIAGLAMARAMLVGMLLLAGGSFAAQWVLRDHRWIGTAEKAAARRRLLAGMASLAFAAVVVVALIAWPAYERWITTPNAVHAPFGPEILCKSRGRWLCLDRPGPSVNAADFEVTRFLREQLTMEGAFRGRAEFLVNPDPTDTADPRGRNFRDMVRASTSNYESVRNGMVLLALPFQGVPVASSYEQVLDYKYYLLWSRYLNRGASAAPTVNFTTLNHVYPEALALVGVRYLVARDDGTRPMPELPIAYFWRDFRVFEVPGPNVSGFAPVEIIFAQTLEEELEIMRSAAFDPRREVVVSTRERDGLPSSAELSPFEAGEIVLDNQTLVFKARSKGARSFAVLPFRHSSCWEVRWNGAPGTIVRADLGLIGVIFKDKTEVRFTWKAGYLGGRRCLVEDARLIPEAMSAGEAIPY